MFTSSLKLNAATRAPQVGPARRMPSVVAMAKKSKDVRQVITLECTEQKESGVPGMSRYTTQKNRRNTPDRLEVMKYNKYMKVRRHFVQTTCFG